MGSSRQPSNTQDGVLGSGKISVEENVEDSRASSAGPPAAASPESAARTPHGVSGAEQKPSIVTVLEYVRQAFNDETALDTLPIEAAGNVGAWKAWRAYRIRQGSMSVDMVAGNGEKHNDEWNWDGVWEERVRRGIKASTSEAVLYGGAAGGGDDLVRIPRLHLAPLLTMQQLRFAGLDEGLLDEIRLKVLGPAVQT